MKYSKVNKHLNSLENLISHYKDKLPAEEQKVLAEKLAELKKDAEFFSKEKTIERLKNQEKIMSNLEKDFVNRLKTYTNSLKDKSTNKKDLIKKNMSYWAEDILLRNKCFYRQCPLFLFFTKPLILPFPKIFPVWIILSSAGI